MSGMARALRPRWFRFTPGGLLVVLVAVEAFLWVSERFQWFTFNQHKGYAVLIALGAVGVYLLLMLLWFIFALVFRRCFQFTIRSLLALAVAVAIPCGWFAAEMKAAWEQKAATEAIVKLGGAVAWPESQVPGPPWLRNLVGDDLLVNVTLVSLRRRPGFDDAVLTRVEELPQLEMLDLSNTAVTDAGLKHLESLARLGYLDLAGTQVSDAGLEHLKGLRELRRLWLSHAKVSDAGLEYLKGLTKLQWLALDSTKVSDEGVQRLRQALPNCRIFRLK
jgi:hypothetical protein